MDLPHELQRAVFRLSRSLRLDADTVGVTSAEAMLLASIRKAPGIGVTQLASQEGVGRSVISERVAKLQAAGLIRRAKSGQAPDQRRIGLSLTSAGLKAFTAVARRRRGVVEHRLSVLTPDERSALERAVPLLDLLADIDLTRDKKSNQGANK